MQQDNDNIFADIQNENLESLMASLMAQQRVLDLLTKLVGTPTVQAAIQTPEAQAEIKEAVAKDKPAEAEKTETEAPEKPKTKETPKPKKKKKKAKKKAVVENGQNVQSDSPEQVITNKKNSYVLREA